MQRLPQNEFKVLDYTTVCFYPSCLEGKGKLFRVRGGGGGVGAKENLRVKIE